MKAKFKVTSVESLEQGQKLSMQPVSANTYGPNGETEDNDFARYTPSGEIRMYVNNPNLKGAFEPGQQFYVEFTPAN